MTSLRILLVDDDEAWLSAISGLLRDFSRCEVVGQARDGFQAIQRTKVLQPDVILLDIGLPQLDGFQAARQIRTACPKTKIIFLTEFTSPEAAKVAMLLGASGYVFKSEITGDLLNALEAASQDERFVSAAIPSFSLST
jgi:DNA-binding NarL/FixJ family response regulator